MATSMAAHSDLLMEATMETHWVEKTGPKMEIPMVNNLEHLSEMTKETSLENSMAG